MSTLFERFPRLVEETRRASYWIMAPGRYQAHAKGLRWPYGPDDNGAGYGSLAALMKLKGEESTTESGFDYWRQCGYDTAARGYNSTWSPPGLPLLSPAWEAWHEGHAAHSRDKAAALIQESRRISAERYQHAANAALGV